MKDALIVSALSLVPRNRGARCMGAFARTGLSRLVARLFVWAYGVDMAEAEHDMGHYRSLEQLFTRRLKPKARPIVSEADAMASPVDGTVARAGRSVRGQIEVAPGRSFSLSELLGEPVDGERDCAVLYLSPTDYHRVHVPREGHATAWRYVPGTLWPVFPAAVRRVDGLFARNERLAITTQTTAGRLDVVLVGAFGVGRISSVVCDITTNTGARAAESELAQPMPLQRGADLGVFHLGSTVILVAEPGKWRWTVQPGQAVRMGQRIARLA